MASKFLLLSINFICMACVTQTQIPDINFKPDKIITVDNFNIIDGSAQDNNSAPTQTNCTQYSSMVYTCPSFEAALEMLDNNTIVNIMTDVVLLQSIVHLTELNNIAIVGQNKTIIECNSSGVLNYSSCSNLHFRGITWSKCGTYINKGISTYQYPSIIFSNCSNLFFQYCVFQNSTSAVYLSEISDTIQYAK